jgi:CRISPR-associated exonuclease Cas4
VGSLVIVALVLFGAALFLLAWAGRQRQELGLPAGEIVDEDMSGWQRCQEPLRSVQHGLLGRPDYLVQDGKQVIPIEVKPSRHVARPYESDVGQLLAYCLLVEEAYGRPPYGLLRYAERTFRIPYTPQTRRRLVGLLAQMREESEMPKVPPNHDQPRRCRGCGYRAQCAFRLD